MAIKELIVARYVGIVGALALACWALTEHGTPGLTKWATAGDVGDANKPPALLQDVADGRSVGADGRLVRQLDSSIHDSSTSGAAERISVTLEAMRTSLQTMALAAAGRHAHDSSSETAQLEHELTLARAELAALKIHQRSIGGTQSGCGDPAGSAAAAAGRGLASGTAGGTGSEKVVPDGTGTAFDVRAKAQPSVCTYQSKSQHTEDKKLLRTIFSNGQDPRTETAVAGMNGTYVEIGGLDGVRYSNTYLLHTCFGWAGVVVEGSPHNAKQLEENVPKHRPGTVWHHGAVCAPPQTHVDFSAGENGPVQGDVEHLGRDRAHSRGLDKSVAVVKVPCRPMSEYLGSLDSIDLFSLDVEGAELEVLLTMDFKTKAPKVLMIELDSTNESKNWKIVNLLVNMLGYRYYPTMIRNSGLFIRGDIPYSNPNYPTAPAWQHTHLH